MTIKTQPMGPGTLTFGVGPLAVSSQVRAATVEWTESVTRKEAKKVLSGEELPASEKATYTAVLKVKVIQEMDNGGLVAWSYANRGTDQAVEFVPNTAEGGSIDGTIRPVPITLGGEVDDDSPESDFTWSFVDLPALTTNTP